MMSGKPVFAYRPVGLLRRDSFTVMSFIGGRQNLPCMAIAFPNIIVISFVLPYTNPSIADTLRTSSAMPDASFSTDSSKIYLTRRWSVGCLADSELKY